jgi:polyvinyl alcohol dehydrogenase (cytochrome)
LSYYRQGAEEIMRQEQTQKKWCQGISRWTFFGMLVLLLAAFGGSIPTTRAASGDWPTYVFDNGRSGFNSAETIINPNTASNLKLHWSYHGGGAISSQPVEANGMIYWGSWDGLEHATNLNGTLIWSTNLGRTIDTSCVPSKVGVASTATVTTVPILGLPTPVVFVGGGDAHFYALNANTGAIIWNTFLGSSPSHFIWSSPTVYNGSVYIGVSSFGNCPPIQGEFVQMDASTGTIQHNFNMVPTGCIGGSVWGSPAIDENDGSLYIATGNKSKCSQSEALAFAVVKLQAVDLTLVSSWQVPPVQRTKDSDFGSTPTLFQATIGGTLHKLVGVANKNGIFYAFDRSSLRSGPVWQATVANPGPCAECGDGSISPGAWDGSVLYAAGGTTTINGSSCKGSLRAINPANGSFIWEHCFNEGPVLAAVTVVPGVVVAGEGTDMVVIATATGQTLFTYLDANSNSRFFGAASISNGVLYIGNRDRNFYAFGM